MTLEIAPVPHRAARGERRWLALGLVVLVPVVLLVLLPAVLGLDRHVVTDRSMDGTLSRGSLVLTRGVPAADLRVDDVLSLPTGAAPGERATRRIVALRDGVATLRADSAGGGDVWTLALDGSVYDRVELGVPWVGYPFLVDGGWLLLVLVAAAALAVALALALVPARRGPPAAVESARSQLPVG